MSLRLWIRRTGTALCVCLVAVTARGLAGSSPAFWQISAGDAQVYLLGSMHFGHPDFYPLPSAVETAFEKAGVLAVEVDIVHISPREAEVALFKHAGLPRGKSLPQVVPDDVYQALARRAKSNGIPVQAFNRFQPWFVSLQLVEAEIRKTALRQDLGIDWHFLKRAKDKQIHELETLNDQLALFSQLPMDQQAHFLEQTLTDLEHSQKYLRNMAEAWRGGETEHLETLMIQPFENNEQAAPLFKALFSDRNRQMAAAAADFLRGDETVFFVVGAGHLLGADGIIALLRDAGHEVTRVNTQAHGSASLAADSQTP